MKGFARLVFLFVAGTVLAVSCSKDEDTGSLVFDTPAVYFAQEGEEITVHYTAVDMQTVSVSSKPTGWDDPVLNTAAQTLTIKAPVDLEEDGPVKSGSIVITGIPTHGSVKSATLFVGVIVTRDLDKTANSYLINGGNTNYTFNAKTRGDGSSLATASVGVIWQSSSSMIQYLQLVNGKASFYIGVNADDDTKVKEGNALIGAYNANGTLIWSWHVWASDYDPEKDVLAYSNGYKVMSRNLGALKNANSTNDEILASYGLYYQWGRKDPFIGPSTYLAPSGAEAPMYSGSGNRVYTHIVASDAVTGKMEYANENPLHFIKGVGDSKNDWLFSAHDNALWGATKTVNDPCPAGWKVAPAAAFQGLSIEGTPSAADAGKFGWTLTDGTVKSLYIAAGRRTYLFGKIVNVYIPVEKARSAEEAQPWIGNYWTSDTAPDTQSQALYFWFEKKTATGGIENAEAYARANGMSVRCVKE